MQHFQYNTILNNLEQIHIVHVPLHLGQLSIIPGILPILAITVQVTDSFGTNEATITQIDGGITPDSLTPASGSPEGSFVDDNYSDQESVFGNGEMEYIVRSLDEKFTRAHDEHQTCSKYDRSARMFRLSQTLNLDIPQSSTTAIEVEQYVEHPSAASFPENDVEIPGYHYHLGRRRILSLSSPELHGERTSDATWRSRMWNWGRSFRRRRW